MTQSKITKQHFREQMSQIMAHLTAREWKEAHVIARQYTQQMNQAFVDGQHQAAFSAREHLSTLREPTYRGTSSIHRQQYLQWKTLSKDRLYRAFVVDYCPLDPWQATSFLLHDDSGSDAKLVDKVLKNGFFRPEHLVDETERQSEAKPRLAASLDFIGALQERGNHLLASRLIEGLLHDEDLRVSPFVFDEKVISVLSGGKGSLFFRQFLERMAPRIEEIQSWSRDPDNRREPCLRAQNKAAIRGLAEQGLTDLALKLYLNSSGQFASSDELMLAEEVFEIRFTHSMLVELAQTTTEATTFEGFVEYFIKDPESRWPYNSSLTDDPRVFSPEGDFYIPPKSLNGIGGELTYSTNILLQSRVIKKAFEAHKDDPGIDEKRASFMQLYITSFIENEDVILRDIRQHYPVEYLMDIPGFPETRLQEDLGL